MMETILNDFTTSVAYLIPLVGLWMVAWKVFDFVHSKLDLRHELTENDNPAVCLSIVGYNIGLILALGGLLTGTSSDILWIDVVDTLSYGALAVVLLNLSALINDKLIFRRISTQDELLKGNTSVGFVECGNYLTNGLILYGALGGEGSLITGLAFWGLGQVTLLLASYVYNLITKFDSNAEIAGANAAVGVAYAGFLVAIGIIIQFAGGGDFISWSENLTRYAFVVGFSFIFLPIVRTLLDLVVLHHASLSKELAEDKNVGIGAVEASFYISAALLSGWILLG